MGRFDCIYCTRTVESINNFDIRVVIVTKKYSRHHYDEYKILITKYCNNC